nr:folylpolyglutamate synthase/dihydrofolate synthase family protein [uncultured Dethiosulfovibrio sp.]
MNLKSYEEVDSYLTTLSNPGINPGLERVSMLLDLLDNPEERFPAVHVVGTNGKGSTSAMIDRCFRESGYRSALYTSPHLVHFGERLTVNGVPVSSDKWMNALKRMESIVDSNVFFDDDRPTYFELLTVAAILIMSESDLDVAIVEAGMGGRLDATNRLANVVLSVITPIAMDHCEYLGNTLEAVASEKFAVIRPGNRAVFAGDDGGNLSDQFIAICDKLGSDCVVADIDYTITSIKTDFRGTEFKILHQGKVESIRTSLVGRYQARNGRLAYVSCKQLQELFPKMTDRAVLGGLADTVWPGRLEVLPSPKGTVLVDGAHNPHGMKALVETIPELIGDLEIGVLYTSMNDKDYDSILEILSKIPCRLFCTSLPGNLRCASSGEVLDKARRFDWSSPPEAFDDPAEALERALEKFPLVLCCGSLYLVAWVSGLLKQNGSPFR